MISVSGIIAQTRMCRPIDVVPTRSTTPHLSATVQITMCSPLARKFKKWSVMVNDRHVMYISKTEQACYTQKWKRNRSTWPEEVDELILAWTIICNFFFSHADDGGGHHWQNLTIEFRQVRKIFTCGSFLIQMLATLLISYMDSAEAVIICLTVLVGMDGFATYTYRPLFSQRKESGLFRKCVECFQSKFPWLGTRICWAHDGILQHHRHDSRNDRTGYRRLCCAE